jgi:hypothetical protein
MRNFLFFLLLTGCGENIYFSDDEAGPRHQASATGAHDDDLSLPYALGTQVGLTVKGPVSNTSKWQIVSDQPSLFSVTSMVQSDGSVVATGHALAEGEGYIRLVDGNGNELRSAQISVKAADSARLFSHGDLRILTNDDSAGFDAAEAKTAYVLAGGKAVFPVAYYHAAQRVYGRGISQTGDPTAQVMATSGDATNEWLFVTPPTPETYTVSLKQGSTTLAQLTVNAVPESALVDVTLSDQETHSRNDKDQIWVLARAHQSDGHEVLGVYCDWTLDGALQNGDNAKPAQGDLYRYHYAADQERHSLAATRGPLSGSLTISAHDGRVYDTTYLGCSYGGGGPTRPSLVALAALFLLLCVRNRKSSSGIATYESSAPATNERGR